MADYDNTNSFVLFVNDKKESEKQPDYKGKFTDENGKEWEVAAWKRVSKAGNTFLSGKVSEPRPKQDIGDEPINLSDIPF